jgi:Mg-chelatase subunit ChlD
MIIKDVKCALHLYGETTLEALSGFKRLDLEAFQGKLAKLHLLKRRLEDHFGDLKKAGLLTVTDLGSKITKKGIELAALSLIFEEISISGKLGLGEHHAKEHALRSSGEPLEVRPYRKGDKYRDLNIRQTLKTVILRRRNNIIKEDLRVFERSKMTCFDFLYVLDISGSMKGKKIDAGKRAAIALTFASLKAGDKVGVLAFNVKTYRVANITNRIEDISVNIAALSPSSGTNISLAIKEAREFFAEQSSLRRSKHIILISDAIPTTGKKPIEDTYEEASITVSQGISISVIGIDLSKDGFKIAQRIADIGQGVFYHITNPGELRQIVLEEHERVHRLI